MVWFGHIFHLSSVGRLLFISHIGYYLPLYLTEEGKRVHVHMYVLSVVRTETHVWFAHWMYRQGHGPFFSSTGRNFTVLKLQALDKKYDASNNCAQVAALNAVSSQFLNFIAREFLATQKSQLGILLCCFTCLNACSYTNVTPGALGFFTKI